MLPSERRSKHMVSGTLTDSYTKINVERRVGAAQSFLWMIANLNCASDLRHQTGTSKCTSFMSRTRPNVFRHKRYKMNLAPLCKKGLFPFGAKTTHGISEPENSVTLRLECITTALIGEFSSLCKVSVYME